MEELSLANMRVGANHLVTTLTVGPGNQAGVPHIVYGDMHEIS